MAQFEPLIFFNGLSQLRSCLVTTFFSFSFFEFFFSFFDCFLSLFDRCRGVFRVSAADGAKGESKRESRGGYCTVF